MSSKDERVVEMRFDNAQFERGVRQTLSSLDRLKEGLKFNNVVNGVGIIQNAINNLKLNGISQGVDQINSKFSALGIAGMEVVRRLTDSALNAVAKVATAIPNQIKSGGWSRALNIENAKFQLEGLGVAWDTVNKDLSYAVNGTAYGLDSAAKVAAQLTASGIKASDSIKLTSSNVDDLAQSLLGTSSATARANGDLDDMAIALRSISGVAAMTNSSYDDIGYIFTRIAGQGRVMGEDLNSLAARGLNAAATLGQALGKSESEIRDMVSKGDIDFKTFSDAMYDAFADHAVKANATFVGALSNTKAALSKIGADVAEKVLPAVTKILNSVRLLFNAVRKYITPLTSSIGKVVTALGDTVSAVVDKITGKVQAATGAVGGPVNAISGFLDNLADKIQKVGSFFGVKSDEVKDTATDTAKTVTEAGASIDEIAKQVIHGDYGNGQTRIDQLRALGYCFEEVQNKVNEMLGCDYRYEVQAGNTTEAVKEQTDAVKESGETTKQAAEDINATIANNFMGGFANIAKTIKLIFTSIGSSIQAVASTFHRASENDILKFSEEFNSVTGTIVNNADKIGQVKQVISDLVFGVGNVVKVIGGVLKAFASALVDTISEIHLMDPTELSGSFKELTDNLLLSKDGAEGLKDIFKLLLSPLKIIVPLAQLLSKALLKVVSGIAKVNKGFLEFIGRSKVLKSLSKIFSQIGNAVKEVFDRVSKSDGFQKLIDSAGKLKDAIGTHLSEALDSLSDNLSKFNGIDMKGSGIDKVVSFLSGAAEKLSELLEGMTDIVNGKVNPFQVVIDWFKDLAKSIKESNIADAFSKLDIGKAISNLKKNIADKFKNTNFSDVFQSLKTNLGSSLQANIGGALSGGLSGGNVSVSTSKSGEGIFSFLKSFADSLKAKVESIDWDSIAKSIKNGFGIVLSAIAEALQNPNLQIIEKHVLDFIKILLLFKMFNNLGNMFKSFAGAAKSIKGFFGNLSSTIKGLKKMAKTKLRVKAFREIAISIAILVASMAGIAAINKFGDLPKALGTVSLLIGELMGIFILIGKLKLDNKAISSVGNAALKLSAGVGIIALAMGKFTKFNPDQWKVAIIRLMEVLGLMVGLLTIMSAFSRYKISGGPFLGLAVALTLMLIPLNLIALMPYTLYTTGIERLCTMMDALMIAIAVMNLTAGKAGGVKGSALLAFAVDLIAMTIALSILAHQPYGGIIVAAATIAGVMIALGVAMRLASKNKNATKNALAFAVEVVAVGIMLSVLAHQPMEGMITAAASMAGVMLVLGAAMMLASKNKNATANALAFAVEVVAIGTMLAVLANQPIEGMIVAAASMAGVMLVLSLAMILAGKNASAAINALAFAAAAAAVGLSLAVLASLPVANIIAAAAAIAGAAIALAFAGIIGIVGAPGLSAIAVAAIALGAAIGIAALGIAAAMLAFGVAAKMVAEAVTMVTGAFTMLIVALAPIADSLPSVAVGIIALAAAAAIAGVAMIPLSVGMLAVGAASLVFAAGLTVLGVALQIAAAGTIAFAVGFAEAAAIVSNSIGSILSVIPGLSEVGDKLKGVSTEITENLESIDTSGVGERIIKKLTSGMDKGLPDIDSSMAKAKEKVQNGATSISGATAGTGETIYKNVVGGTENIPGALAGPMDQAKTVVTSKVDETGAAAQNSASNSISSIQALFGNIDLSGDGSALMDQLASGISGNGSPIDTSSMTLDQIKALFGNTDFSGDGSALMDQLASGISGNGNPANASSITLEQLQTVFGNADFSGNGSNYMNQIASGMAGNASPSNTANMSVKEIEQIFGSADYTAQGYHTSGSYASGISSGNSNVMAAASTLPTSASQGAENRKTDMQIAGQRAANQYINSVIDMKGKAQIAGTNLTLGAVAGANSGNRMQSAGRSQGNAFATGVSSASGQARANGAILSNSAVSGASGGYSGMYSAGRYASMGFANGISAYASVAAARAASMVRSAISAAKRAADERSPSKKTYQIGKFFVLGMANAVSDLGYLVSNNATDMVADAMSSMQNTIANIMDGASSNFDMSPTITPVVDLSQVGAGASTIDSIFSASQAAAISYGMAQRYQNESLVDQLSGKINDAVNAAVQRLSEVTADRPIEISVPLSLNGREIAKGTAVYMKPELDSLNQRELRKEGIR